MIYTGNEADGILEIGAAPGMWGCSHHTSVASFPTTEITLMRTRFQSDVERSEMTAAFGRLVSPKFQVLLSPKFPHHTVQDLNTLRSSPRKGLTV